MARDKEARSPGGRRLIATIDSNGFLRKVAEKLCRISDLAAGFGQRLAHLQRHQQREVVDSLV